MVIDSAGLSGLHTLQAVLRKLNALCAFVRPQCLHPAGVRLSIQPLPEQLVDLLRIRLALGGLHDLADEITH